MKIFILNIIDVNGVLFNFHGNTVKELEKAWRDFKSDVPTLEGITIKINEKEKTIQIFRINLCIFISNLKFQSLFF